MNLFIVLIILLARKHAMDNRNTYRSRDGFNFESDDSKFPYDGYQFYGTKKAAIFNYSEETFRKKKASGAGGLYLIDGGNIPSDMAGSASYGGPPTTDNPYPTIACGLNVGTATRLEAVTSINLSSNPIAEYPTPCKSLGENTYPELNSEQGTYNKPNFLYLPTYQYSCSDHPRAAGLAHEDNYDCLKKPMSAGNSQGYCCAAAAGCITNGKLFKKGYNLDGTPKFETQPSTEDPFFEFFNCLGSTGGNPGKLPPYYQDGRRESFQREECGFQNSCKSGFNKGWMGTGNGGCLSFSNTCQCTGSGKTRWAPLAFGVSRLYNISGNTECDSCKQPGGMVFIAGYTDCWYCMKECWILNDAGLPDKRCMEADGTVTPPKITHTCDGATTIGNGGGQFCACNFTDTIDVGGSHGQWYITTFSFPTNMFANWSPFGVTTGGNLGSTSCNGEFVYDCGEVS